MIPLCRTHLAEYEASGQRDKDDAENKANGWPPVCTYTTVREDCVDCEEVSR